MPIVVFDTYNRYDLEGEDNAMPIPTGAVDAKVVDAEGMKTMTAHIIAGPTHDGDMPVFEFAGQWADIPHDNMPDRWDFDWITAEGFES